MIKLSRKYVLTILSLSLLLPLSFAQDFSINDRDIFEVKVVFTAPTPILSSRVSSEVTTIHKFFGEAFEQGEILVTLKDTLLRADYEAAASVSHSHKVKFDALKSLYQDENASLVEFEQAQSQHKVAHRNTAEAKDKLDACIVRAPFKGRVVEELVQEHELAKQDQPLIKIINDSNLFAQFLLPEKMFAKVKPNQMVEIHVKALNKTVSGMIKYISAEIDPASQTFEVKAEVQNSEDLLRSGMNGVLDLNKYINSL